MFHGLGTDETRLVLQACEFRRVTGWGIGLLGQWTQRRDVYLAQRATGSLQ